MEFVAEYGLFLARVLTFLVALFVVLGLLSSFGSKYRKTGQEGHIEITPLNDRFKGWEHQLKHSLLGSQQLKQQRRAERKQQKAEQKARAKGEEQRKRVFVLEFHGDMQASAVENLRNEISALLTIAREKDEVMLSLESSGGLVHSYGLAASQLQRLTDNKIPLTIAVDKVAASGGYMMACIADRIIAAPFAVVGSIGVIAQLPNFNRLLKKNDIDFEMHTAGDYKRTLTLFGENTEEGREKFVEELEDTHKLFKEFVSQHRPQVAIEQVATGEIWFGSRALERNLVDGIQTSDDYLMQQRDSADLVALRYIVKKSLPERLGLATQQAVDRVIGVWLRGFSGRGGSY